MSVIDKPGFYTSKAGKCEVVAIKGDYAFGLANDGTPACWCLSGGTIWAWNDYVVHHITGPYIEPRKPVEAWAVQTTDGKHRLYDEPEEAKAALEQDCYAMRLIHLREVEDEKP